MKNLIAIAREILVTSGTPLYAQVATRVYFDAAPDGFLNDKKILIIHGEGSGSHITGGSHEWDLIVKSYAATANRADPRVLFGLVYDRLHNKQHTVTSGDTLKTWRIPHPDVVQLEPDTGYPYHTSRFRMLVEG